MFETSPTLPDRDPDIGIFTVTLGPATLAYSVRLLMDVGLLTREQIQEMFGPGKFLFVWVRPLIEGDKEGIAELATCVRPDGSRYVNEFQIPAARFQLLVERWSEPEPIQMSTFHQLPNSVADLLDKLILQALDPNPLLDPRFRQAYERHKAAQEIPESTTEAVPQSEQEAGAAAPAPVQSNKKARSVVHRAPGGVN